MQPTAPNTGRLFTNRNGGPLTRFGVRYLLRKYVAAVGTSRITTIRNKRLHPHSMRHYFLLRAMCLYIRQNPLKYGKRVNSTRYSLGSLPPRFFGKGAGHEIPHQRASGSDVYVKGR